MVWLSSAKGLIKTNVEGERIEADRKLLQY